MRWKRLGFFIYCISYIGEVQWAKTFQLLLYRLNHVSKFSDTYGRIYVSPKFSIINLPLHQILEEGPKIRVLARFLHRLVRCPNLAELRSVKLKCYQVWEFFAVARMVHNCCFPGILVSHIVYFMREFWRQKRGKCKHQVTNQASVRRRMFGTKLQAVVYFCTISAGTTFKTSIQIVSTQECYWHSNGNSKHFSCTNSMEKPFSTTQTLQLILVCCGSKSAFENRIVVVLKTQFGANFELPVPSVRLSTPLKDKKPSKLCSLFSWTLGTWRKELFWRLADAWLRVEAQITLVEVKWKSRGYSSARANVYSCLSLTVYSAAAHLVADFASYAYEPARDSSKAAIQKLFYSHDYGSAVYVLEVRRSALETKLLSRSKGWISPKSTVVIAKLVWWRRLKIHRLTNG